MNWYKEGYNDASSDVGNTSRQTAQRYADLKGLTGYDRIDYVQGFNDCLDKQLKMAEVIEDAVQSLEDKSQGREDGIQGH